MIKSLGSAVEMSRKAIRGYSRIGCESEPRTVRVMERFSRLAVSTKDMNLESNDMASPVFVVGAERSGTTMFGLMLSHHPAIAYLGEFEFALEKISGDSAWPDVDEYIAWLRTDRIFVHKELAVDRGMDYPDLVRSFVTQRKAALGGDVAVAKLCRAFDQTPRVWPRAKFIHLVRDGRDVAHSVIGMGWAGNAFMGADFWIKPERTWDRLLASLNSDQWIEVRYEELVTDPEPILRRVCDFLGIAFHGAMLEYDEHSTYDKPDKALASQWQRRMSERDVRLIESKAATLLEDRGYLLSGLRPIEPSRLEVAFLRMQSRIRCASFRVRRYGFLLWLGLAITSRCGPASVFDRLTVKSNAITNAHLK